MSAQDMEELFGTLTRVKNQQSKMKLHDTEMPVDAKFSDEEQDDSSNLGLSPPTGVRNFDRNLHKEYAFV